MIGIFFEDWGDIHHFWTILFFALMLLVKILAGMVTWRLGFEKYVPIYGWAIIVLDAVVIFTSNSFAVFEWASVFAALGLVGIISYNFLKIK